ncbi:hypothetical protein [Pengzhenrongella frigida]|uniref:Uncharacterized protein n=1 Tax=Pengzhenrongella frigida TaxID=1259133 RepID=A0A4Q5MX01_9MICO|nr:hypothetical protein [Cellulomonas sp. HLT2-17]RYV50116.1 hypothetical protein EUA98_15090 [Cellulomonas sp. HLT2-17]
MAAGLESAVPEPGRSAPDRPAASGDCAREETTGRNTAATVGLVLGLVSVVVNPILLVGIAAIGFSAFGYNRASLMSQFGYAPIGKRKAVLGMILGLLGIIESVVFKGSLF